MGVRASVCLYDRGHTAVSHMRPGEVDWARIFEERKVRWFHTGGIFPALSDTCVAVALEAVQAARRAGTIVSYDLNFRGKLWSSERAIEVTRELVPHVDVLIGNEEDFQKTLGFTVPGADPSLRSLPVEAYERMVTEVVATYPELRVVGTTLREVTSGQVNNWSAVLYQGGRCYRSRRYQDLAIEDRVGGGDGFSAGVIYGLLEGMPPEDSVELGAAHGALVQSTRGDTSMVTLAEVKSLLGGGTARIDR